MWSRAVIAAVVLIFAVGVAADVETVFAELTDGDRGELQLSDQESNTIVSQLFTEIMREGFADADTNVFDRDNDNAAETAELNDDEETDSASKMRFAKASASLAQKAHGFFGKLKNIAKAALKVADNVMQSGDTSPAGLAASIGSNLVRGLGKGVSSRVGKRLIDNVAKRAGRWLGGQFGSARFKKRKDYSGVTANSPRVSSDHEPADVEDCVACRYVWMQVEMDVGNSMIEENIYDAFHANALEAQKTPIFYPACQTMFDSIDDMLGDYMDGYSVNQICENSMLCR